jgi:vitamin B12 transporter
MTSRRIPAAALAAVCLLPPLLPLPLRAQPQPDLVIVSSLDPIVVSATRTPQRRSELVLPVTVITREDIERTQAPSLVDLLQGQAGVEAGRNGGPGTQSSIFLRGQNSISLVVFVDGVRMQTDTSGGLKLVDIPPEQIERIEILRGPVGALYGESAIGGAIHITTRADASASGPTFKAGYGTRQTSDVAAGYHLSGDDYRLGLSLQRFDTKGSSAINTRQAATANPDRDGYQRQSVFLNGEKQISPELSLGLSAHRIEGETDYDNSGLGVVDTDTHVSRSHSTDITGRLQARLSAAWTTSLRLTSSGYQAREYLNGNRKSDGLAEGQQTSWGWTHQYVLGPGQLSFGLEGGQAEFETADLRFTRATLGYYLGYNGRSGPLDYQAQARRDQAGSRAGGKTIDQDADTWLLGAGYWLTEQFKLFGSYATAFRAPAPSELFDVPAWGTTGNPDLKAEEHQGREVGLQVLAGWGSLRLAAFDSRTRNAIAYDAGNYLNIGRVENEGVELSLDGAAQGWTYQLSAVSQDPRNAETGERLKRRARDYATLMLGKNLGRLDIGAQVLASGERLDSDIATYTETRLARYTVVNLNASYTLTPEWTARLKVENATDEDYQLAHGYNATPLGAFLSVQYRPR